MNEKTMTFAEVVATPFAAFDHRAAYEEHLRPLVDKLFSECVRLNIPMFFAAGTYQEENGNGGVTASAHMIGIERTPAQLLAAAAMASCDVEQASAVMHADQLRTMAARARIEAEQQMTSH